MLRGIGDGPVATSEGQAVMRAQNLTERLMTRRTHVKAELELLEKTIKLLEDKPEMQAIFDAVSQLGL